MNIFQNLYNQDMEIQRVVSTNLIKLRGEMSRQELAGLAGVSYQHIYEIEEQLKNPSLKVLDRLAKALSVDLAELLKVSEQKQRPVKISSVLRMMAAIPDDIYLSASEFELNHPMWDEIRSVIKNAKIDGHNTVNHPPKKNHS